ncbi:MAG: hypothetical protein ACLFUZ_05120 [Candidatus Micrarchaeia archaeon]
MKSIYATLMKREYTFSRERDFAQLVVFSFLAFSIPFFFPHPQLVTGIIVNAFLVFAALGMDGRNVLPVVMLPSIGAIANGLLFGPLTIFLIYMVPFIWIGNFVLVLGIKHFMQDVGKNFAEAGGTSVLLKAGVIFLPAYLLYLGGVLPEALLLPMGAVQLATGVGGLIVVGAVQRIIEK